VQAGWEENEGVGVERQRVREKGDEENNSDRVRL
jgi:hypothetical protein